MLGINLYYFASDAGYYWVEMFDHFSTGINLPVFLVFQLLVWAYALPIDDMAEKVADHGEHFPRLYKFLITYICPVGAILLVIFGILKEIRHPEFPEHPTGKLISLIILFLPISFTVVLYILNPCRRSKK
jgi:hypothetical protein